MRLRGFFVWILIAAVAMPLGGCDMVRPFEEVCARKLDAASVTVETAPVQYETDFSQSSSQLTARGAHAAGRIVLGLTETRLKSTFSFSGNGIVKPITGRYCMRPVVSVKLAFEPMKLFVASEQKPGSCEHKITLDHERRHMGVYANYLDTLSERITQEMKQKFGDRILYFSSTAEAEAQVRTTAAEILKPYMEKGMTEVQQLQKAVDSPEEYARMDTEQMRCVNYTTGGGVAPLP
ncbi:MAG TPA: hypothetical protein VGN52_09565 [Burkholderiales bacterium]